MRVIIFSIGKEVESLWDMIYKENDWLYVLCFVDNDVSKIGKSVHDKKVIPPQLINEYEYDYIAIGSRQYYDEIEKQLLLNHKIEKRKIVYLYDFFVDNYIKRRYLKKYNSGTSEPKKSLNKLKVVVYTAITGTYDSILEPMVTDENVDYVCFTDDKKLQPSIWNLEILKKDNLDSSRLSRKVKTMPDQFFSGYDLSIWVDANLQIRGSLLEYAESYMRGCDMLCFPHPWRNCVYEEAAVVKKLGLDNNYLVDRQIDFLKQDGFPMDYGLVAGGCLVRFHNKDAIKQFGQKWWSMILNGSKRDQLSMTYACWKMKVPYDISDLNILNNKYLLRLNHK